MQKNKIKIYCVLLMFVAFMATVSLSVGTAFARYENTVSCATVLETYPKEIISDCMRKVSEPALTVLLGELNEKETKEVAFTMKASGEAAKGNMSWSYDESYINVSMKYGDSSISSGAEIELPANAEKTFTMILTRKSDVDSPRTAEDVNIIVSFGNMQGAFCVTVPGTSGEVSDNSQSGVVEESSGSSTAVNSSAPSDTDNTAAEEIAENTENSDSSGVLTESESSSETLFVGQGSEATSIKMYAPSKFDPKQGLPLKIETTGTDTVILGLEDDGKTSGFPAKTIYSADNGNSCYMLYDSGTAKIKNQNMDELFVLLDFSQAEIDKTKEMTVMAESYTDGISAVSTTAKTLPNAAESCKTTVQYPETDEENSSEESEEEVKCPVLFHGSTLIIGFPEEWTGDDYVMDYSLEMLMLNETGAAEYKKLAVTEGESSEDETAVNDITFHIGDNLPPAGTYRISINWKYKGISFYTKQMTFFINYSVHTGYTTES